jgi:hypothetical protein
MAERNCPAVAAIYFAERKGSLRSGERKAQQIKIEGASLPFL